MVRRNIHGLLGLRDRPQLYAPVSDAFRALLARTKSKPSIPLSGREVIAKSAPTISAKPVGVGARFQPWIVKDERSGLWTRTGGDGRRFIVTADQKVSAFVELEGQVLTMTFYLEYIQ